jgi:hypothetical protein
MTKFSSVEAFMASITDTLAEREASYGRCDSFCVTTDLIWAALEDQLPPPCALPDGFLTPMFQLVVKLARLNHQIRKASMGREEPVLGPDAEDTLRDIIGYTMLIWSQFTQCPLKDPRPEFLNINHE